MTNDDCTTRTVDTATTHKTTHSAAGTQAHDFCGGGSAAGLRRRLGCSGCGCGSGGSAAARLALRLAAAASASSRATTAATAATAAGGATTASSTKISPSAPRHLPCEAFAILSQWGAARPSRAAQLALAAVLCDPTCEEARQAEALRVARICHLSSAQHARVRAAANRERAQTGQIACDSW